MTKTLLALLTVAGLSLPGHLLAQNRAEIYRGA
jgi:hypothetical protein